MNGCVEAAFTKLRFEIERLQKKLDHYESTPHQATVKIDNLMWECAEKDKQLEIAREYIEAAPHDTRSGAYCGSLYRDGGGCNCWKSKALEKMG